MDQELARLREIAAEIDDLRRASAVLEWDQQTYMPERGAEQRGEQLATLGRLAHQRLVDEETGRLLDALGGATAAGDPDGQDARLVRRFARDRRRAIRVPGDWVVRFARMSTIAFQAWQEAKAASDFARFRPHLEDVVALRREYAGFFEDAAHPYDALLEDYEPGMTTADVRRIFDLLRPRQTELIRAIAARPPVDDGFLRGPFPEQGQWDFGVEVASAIGYDWSRGRQDRSVHPFSTAFGADDVRITTRLSERWLPAALFGTMHETGHALYELGFDRALARTPLAEGASLAIHESQSRLWENLIGRSHAFWERFYPALRARFPSQLGEVGLERFWRGINRVQPSLIRVEADEATYNLHIMLRLELEIALVEGSLAVRDLPAAWNARMQEYLGVLPPDDARGVLQDVHWSGGTIGYFPTYALGNVVAAQLWDRMAAEIGDPSVAIRRGEFASILGWLREKVHRHGAKFEPQELVRRVTGSPIDPAPYLRYLRLKYGEIYEL